VSYIDLTEVLNTKEPGAFSRGVIFLLFRNVLVLRSPAVVAQCPAIQEILLLLLSLCSRKLYKSCSGRNPLMISEKQGGGGGGGQKKNSSKFG
jgi:hypothetical protein